MQAVLRFPAFSLVLAAALGLVPLAPPEHAHQTETSGHRQIVVHQHSEAHAMGHPSGGRGDRRAFDHPDDPILTLSTVYTAQAPQLPAVPVRTVIAIIQPLQAEAGRASHGFVELLIHGPPRVPTGPRAPPASPA